MKRPADAQQAPDPNLTLAKFMAEQSQHATPESELTPDKFMAQQTQNGANATTPPVSVQAPSRRNPPRLTEGRQQPRN